jgi:hypothetical protein
VILRIDVMIQCDGMVVCDLIRRANDHHSQRDHDSHDARDLAFYRTRVCTV